MKKIVSHIHKKTPGWAEITYMNTVTDKTFTKREFMLAWLFATLQNHNDVALGYAQKAFDNFRDPLFITMESYSETKLRNIPFTIKGITKLAGLAIKKYFF